MPRNFDSVVSAASQRGVRFWLQSSGIVLAILNGIALFLYFAPPGGSRAKLTQESQQIRNQIAAARARSVRLKNVSEKVQLGSGQSADFEAKYFIPKRTAYGSVISEIQRMAKNSGVQEREAVFAEEPIEGTSDLSLLNVTADYQGSYDSLLRFLNAADHSPMLLMLDALGATPQQKGGEINTSIRFQAVIRDDGSAVSGVRQ
jgi:Tfp pilus assembly protein PilO